MSKIVHSKESSNKLKVIWSYFDGARQMPRGVFISFQHDDLDQAKGFALLQWNKNIDFNFRGRHLLSPVDSENDSYIRQKIREMMRGTSVTVVLIGDHTKDSEWVEFEVQESIARRNAVVGIRLKDHDNTTIPDVLKQNNCKVINWNPAIFSDVVEREALIAGRVPQGPPQFPKTVIGGCARAI